MTISPLALQAKRVIENAWLHGAAYDLASQAAFALESAQLLQSPETAAQSAVSADAVRVAEESVAELRREHEENARLRERIAELEAWKAADELVLPHREASAAASRRINAALELRLRRVRFLHSKGWGANSERCQHDGEQWPCPTLNALDAEVGAAPSRAPHPVEGEHYAAVHHDYRTGRELPEMGGV